MPLHILLGSHIFLFYHLAREMKYIVDPSSVQFTELVRSKRMISH